MSPARSNKQRTAMRIAYAAKIGRIPKSKLKGASLQMFNSMSIAQLAEFADMPVMKKKKRRK